MNLKKISAAAVVMGVLASPVLAQGAGVLNVYGADCRYAVPFDTDKSSLGSAVRRDLLAIAAKHPNVKVRATGYTDAVASNSYNLALSKRRVDAVVAFLQANGAVGWDVTKEALGETHLAVQTSGPELANRRVEIVIGACSAAPAASSSPLAAGGLTAGTAVIGAVTLAVLIAAVVDDGSTPETTTVTTTTK